MHALILAIGIVFAAGAFSETTAQTGTVAVEKAPGSAAMARTVKVTATITAIDAKTREITLRGPQGNEVTIEAGPRVKNFAQMKVGDAVDVEYVEALSLELKKGGGQAVARTEAAGAGGAKAGKMPAGAIGRKITIVADVVAVDPKTQMVTLRGPERTVDLKVRDPAQLKRISKGDQVEATYAQALAVKVEPAKAAAPKK